MGLQPVEQLAGADILVGAVQPDHLAARIEGRDDHALVAGFGAARQPDLIFDLLGLAGADRLGMGAVDRRPALLVEIGLELLEGRAARSGSRSNMRQSCGDQ